MRKSFGIVALLLVISGAVAPAHAQGFAQYVAVGDNQLFVGEPLNTTKPGIVYVYGKSAGQWVEQAQLTASDSWDGDHFGRTILPAGDKLLIGSTSMDDGLGAVYVFERGGDGTWSETTKLQPSDLSEGDYVGRSGAISGNVALLSSWGQNQSRGAVYVFERDASGTWSEAGKVTGDDLEPTDFFGFNPAIRGDWIAVGAAQQDFQQVGNIPTLPNTGAVYLFRRSDDGWAQTQKLTPGLDPFTNFGGSLAFHENRLLVGASGTVRVYEIDEESGDWEPTRTLYPSDYAAVTSFGATIAVAGDEVVIGDPAGNDRRGALYRYRFDEDGLPVPAGIVTVDEMRPNSFFAGTLAIGGNRALVGVPGADFGLGVAIVLEREDGEWVERGRLLSEVETVASVTGGEVECAEGEASIWSCKDVDVLSFLSVSDIGGGRGIRTNDVWGWTDPQSGREYAIVGRVDGTAFVDITDPVNPIYLGNLQMTEGAIANSWRDIKVYKDHAFIVADNAGEHGMQVFDLTRLRDVPNAPVEFEETAHYDGIFSAHNIVINEETGYAYSVGSNGGGETCGGGLHMINIEEPSQPTFAGCFADASTGNANTGYSHDAMCIIYNGPDAEHVGKEVCFGSNETALSIADVTDKKDPTAISNADYPNVAYSHQAWITEDHKYLFMNDEGDESRADNQGTPLEGTRTLIWDVQDLDDPIMVKEHFGEAGTIDHNLYIKGNLMYQSNYESGLRILDISDPENPVEVGYLDTVPGSDAVTTGGGSWSNYPFFESGTIVVTSQGEGVFFLKKAEPQLVP